MLFSPAAGLRKWMARGEIRILGARALRLDGAVLRKNFRNVGSAAVVWGEHTRPACGLRRLAEHGFSGGTPEIARGTRALPRPIAPSVPSEPTRLRVHERHPEPNGLSAVSRKVKVMDIGQGIFLADRFFRLGYSEKSFGNWYRQGPRRSREVWGNCSARRRLARERLTLTRVSKVPRRAVPNRTLSG